MLIHKIFDANDIFDVTMEINAMNIENVQTWLHDPKFNHIKYVVIQVVIMLTKNINISKGVVNGTIAIITSLEFKNDKILQVLP